MLYILQVETESVWDANAAFVVRAQSETEARELAAKADNLSEPVNTIWQDPSKTSCKVIPPSGTAEVLYEFYQAG